MQATTQTSYSIEEYLQQDETAEYRSEYVDGQIIPMAGGTTNHNQIAGNIYAELNFAFKRLDYQVYMADVRLWIPDKQTFTYPDVMVIAGEPEYLENRTDIITNPSVIIEVLSKSTETYDREGKFSAYRTIPAFQEYILLAQTGIYAEQFSKTGEKRWSFREYDASDETIVIDSVDYQLNFVDIYNKVKFDGSPDIMG